MVKYAEGENMEKTFNHVVKIISEIADVSVDSMNEHTNLFEDLEIDSIIILEIVSQLEEEWNFHLADYSELLDEMETIETLVCFLDNVIGDGKRNEEN